MKTMISRSIRLLGCLLFLFAAHAVSAQESDTRPERVWVALRVADGTTGQPASEYYGTLDKKAFASLVISPTAVGLVELHDAAWLQGNKLVPTSSLIDTSDSGIDYGYGTTVYFRAAMIMRIFLLRDDFVKAHFQTPL